MIVYRIAVVHRIHTCPAQPEPHTYDTVRTILSRTTTGPCLTPVAIRPTGVVLPCGRVWPARRWCANCQTRLEIITETEQRA